MRRSLLSALSVLIAGWAMAQSYGNGWIDYDRQYWSFKIWKEGIYRIDSLSLANAGFPIGDVDVRAVQLFGRERQVPLYVQGEGDGQLNTGDFIEFYAKGNDTWLDSLAWDDPAHINNPFYSAFNDTIQYFLTWDVPATSVRIPVAASTGWESVPARPWCWGSAMIAFPHIYQAGKRTFHDASNALFNEAEGYFASIPLNAITSDASQQFDVPAYDPYQDAQVATVGLDVVCASMNDAGNGACPNHHLRVAVNTTPLTDTVFTGYQLNKFHYELPWNSTASSNVSIGLTAVHDLTCTEFPSDYPDRQVMSWARLRYPRKFLLVYDEFSSIEVPFDGTNAPAHIAFPYAPPVMYAWGDTLRRVDCIQDNSTGLWHALVPGGTGTDTKVVISRVLSTIPVTQFQRVNGTGFFHDLGLQLTDSALIIVTHATLMEAAQAYAAYRHVSPIAPYNTIVADVDELYQQFGGGIPKHPLAIRRFVKYVHDHAPTRPRALFLIGKSVKAPPTGGGDPNRGYRRDPLAYARCLVPTMGFPPSDALFTLDLNGTQPNDLTVPVGRLAARTPTDVYRYLDKVQALEGQAPGKWMKNILHFRGGFELAEWQAFDAALESYRLIAEDTCFSGRVIKFIKDGGGVIEQASADSVNMLIEQGVTLMTFFAHAFGGGFDITIDEPANYDWHGRYPTVIGNSCYSGNIHLYDAASASEKFVLPDHAGAIAFLSSVDVGLSGYLQNYTQDFYRSFSQLNYGKSIGDHMRFAVHQQLINPSLEALNSAQTLALHGDPTVVMNSPKEVDLEIEDADVNISPEPVTADADSFHVQAVVRNIGRGTYTPFSVAVQRTRPGLPAGQPVIRQMMLPHFQDTVSFTLPTDPGTGGGQGLNDLEVRVDLDPNVIPELDDQGNNVAHRTLLITSGDLLPVDPYDFAITPDPAPLLQASTGDPFAPVRRYIFQIDTTDLYNSPLREQGQVSAPGGVVSWQPQQIYALNSTQDSMVYYWRCTLDSTGNGEYNWHEFSFQHITDRRGWGQAHYFQFKNDGFNNITYDRPERDFDYYSGLRQIGCLVEGNSVNNVRWTKDLETQEGQGCSDKPSLIVGVVDPFDFSTWMSRYNGVGRFYGNVNDNGNCRSRQEKYFIFRERYPEQMAGMANMLNNEIPDGHFVLIYTYLTLLRDYVDTSVVMPALHGIGANALYNGLVPDSVPYIFFCKKGDPSSVVELWGETFTSIIDTTLFVEVNGHSGAAHTPQSGSALEWTGLSWRAVATEPYDSTRISVTGVTPLGAEQPLLTYGGTSGDADLTPLLSAAQYPQLRLSGSFWNDSVASPRPAQLRRWQLLGTPAPECAIDPPRGFYEHLDSLFQGQPASVMVAVHNISDMAMDSLLMAAWVVDQNNQRHLVHYKRNAPLAVGAVLQDTIRFSTDGFPGTNTLIVEANPHDTATGIYDQPEQYHFNNIATLRFVTRQDKENPVLDVTFDGIHILDGDIVSARPEIQVTLDDENRTLLLDSPGDTIYFKFFLTDPNGTLQRIYFRQGGQEILQFIPATGPENLSKVIYRPTFSQDGVYQLMARATDVSRNNSGDRDYAVRFEVINRPTITEVLNYPNPFTTSTRFVFTLTGHEVPTAMRIQIMTISGRVVREIGMTELGPMHVGRNITEFAWDGTDQFGDRLARGVYLYRVMAQLHGEDIEYRETSAGSYFTKGFGKMYLLR